MKSRKSLAAPRRVSTSTSRGMLILPEVSHWMICLSHMFLCNHGQVQHYLSLAIARRPWKSV